MTTSERQLAYGAWAALCVIWGTTYLAIKICLETIPPALMGGIRFVCASGILGAGLVATRARLPAQRLWPAMALVGVLLIAVGNGGVIVAEQWVPSGVTAVLIGTMPFWMVGLEALVARRERLTIRHVAGLVLGFAGIVLLVWTDIHPTAATGYRFLGGVAVLQIACFGWALGSVYSKQLAMAGDPLPASAMQMFFGGLFMLIVGTIRGEWTTLDFSGRTVAALAYLMVIGSVVAFAAYNYALKHLPMSFVSLYAYINPLVAVALGTVWLDEPLTLRMIAAMVVILSAVGLVKGEH